MFTVKGAKIAKLREAGRLPGTTSGAQKVQATMSGFNQRKQAIEQSRDFTNDAKKRYLAQIQAEEAAARPVVVGQLTSEWGSIKRDYARLKEKQAKAADKAAAAWDYQRLAYEAVRVQQFIQAANGGGLGYTPLGEIRQAYQAAMNSGDKIRARAWAENAPALVEAKARGLSTEERVTAADLSREMQADFEKMTTSPELAAIADEAAGLIARVSDLATITDQARRFWTYTGPFSTPSEFDSLENGVTLRAVYDPATTDFVNTLDIAGEA